MSEVADTTLAGSEGVDSIRAGGAGGGAASELSPAQPSPARAYDAPGPSSVPAGPETFRLLQSVEMDVTVELGRARLPIRDLMALLPGSVVELNRQAGSPVDVLVNGTLFAKGEVVVIDDEFGVRISEIVQSDASRLGL